MVLATGKPKHKASIAKEKVFEEHLCASYRESQQAQDGTKIPADVWTRSRVRTILPSLPGTRAAEV